jgi:type I restriction enzyme S subunit
LTSEQQKSEDLKDGNSLDREWQSKKLEEVAHINLGQSPKGEYYNEEGDGPHFIQGSKNFGNKYPELERFCSKPKREAEEGEVLISVRAPVGPVNIAPEDLCIGRGVTSLKMNEGSNEYLYYYLKYFEDKWSQYADGTTFNSITKSDLQELEIPYPPIEERNTIAYVLDRIDQKLEVNDQASDILEEMAQALFRSWFVDFDEYDGETTYDEDFERDIPISWEKQSLDKIANFLNGKAWQDFSSEDDEENDLPVIKIKELRNGITEDSDLVNMSESPEEYILDNGDIVFSWSASLVLDLWSDGDAFLNQHLFKVTSQEYPRWFCYLWIDHHIRIFRHIAEAKKTTMGHIKRTDLEEAEVLIPPEEKIKEISEEISPIFQKRVECQVENRRLEELRDTLLPKLMSGEVRVNDIELDELEVDSEV